VNTHTHAHTHTHTHMNNAQKRLWRDTYYIFNSRKGHFAYITAKDGRLHKCKCDNITATKANHICIHTKKIRDTRKNK
jgi:hypothetical protein